MLFRVSGTELCCKKEILNICFFRRHGGYFLAAEGRDTVENHIVFYYLNLSGKKKNSSFLALHGGHHLGLGMIQTKIKIPDSDS